MPEDKNNLCVGCPFISKNLIKCPIYDIELNKNKKGKFIRLDICIKENKSKFGGIK